MSLINNDVCLLVEVDGINLLEEGGTDHATSSLADTDTSSNGVVMEAEKRIRREIANSNERRRMQSINAGFQSLRTLLPRHEGEKLSKAAILQQTAEYIYSLEQEKTRLLSQNCQLKRLLNQHEGGDIPSKKRKNENSPPAVSDSSEEASDLSPLPMGLISVTQISSKQDSEEATELRSQLDGEIRLRTLLEEQLRSVQAHVYTEDVRDLSSTHRMTLHYEECTTMPPEVEERVMLEPECEESRSPSPCVVTCAPGQLMEAAIKAEPRVEVEVVEESVPCPASPSRLYLASTSRQNLETIVEAIRHLEGDHLFGEESGDVPLALTMKPEPQPFLISPPHPTVLQTRPGVIVVKHS